MSSILEALERAEGERGPESGRPSLQPVSSEPKGRRFDLRMIGIIVLLILVSNVAIWLFVQRTTSQDGDLTSAKSEAAVLSDAKQTPPVIEKKKMPAAEPPKPALSVPDQLKRTTAPSAKPLIDEAVVARPQPTPKRVAPVQLPAATSTPKDNVIPAEGGETHPVEVARTKISRDEPPPPQVTASQKQPEPKEVSQPPQEAVVISALPESEPDQMEVEQIPLVWELPQGLREKILQLKSSIHVYSETPEQRFVIINMKRYKEGDSLQPNGFRLERIDRDGVVIDHGDGLVRLLRR